MNIEVRAVNRVSDAIAHCPRLSPTIDANDRTPFTDGHIEIYSNNEHKNENWRGRVSVQVKGRSVKKLAKFPRTFRVSRIDLEAFLRSRGVLYFVVAVDAKTSIRTVFYVLLNPFRIKQLLDQLSPDQNYSNIKLRDFPTDSDDIESLVNMAFMMQSEEPKMGFDPKLLENIEQFTILTSRPMEFDQPVTLNYEEVEFSITAITAGGMSIPLSGEFSFVPASYHYRVIELTVSAGEVSFQNPVSRRIDRLTVELVLSEGLTLRLSEAEGGRSAELQIKLQRTLEGRLQDLKFYSSLITNPVLKLGEYEIPLRPSHLTGDQRLIDHHASLERLKSLFDALHTESQLISVDDITEKQSKQLAGLHHAVVDRRAIPQELERSGRVRQPVGDWAIELFCIKDNETNLWRYVDLFDSEFEYRFVARKEDDSDEDGHFLVTPYELIDDTYFFSTLNLHLSKISERYEGLPDVDRKFTLANETVLKLLRASDAAPLRSIEFLDAAKALNDWIIENEGEQHIHLINKWQIDARRGELSEAIRAQIRTVREDNYKSGAANALEIQAACAILLRDDEETLHFLQKLDPSVLRRMKTWPIWTLRNSCDMVPE